MMFRLVCAFVVREQQSQGFKRRGPYDVEAQASLPPSGYALDLFVCFDSLRPINKLSVKRDGSSWVEPVVC